MKRARVITVILSLVIIAVFSVTTAQAKGPYGKHQGKHYGKHFGKHHGKHKHGHWGHGWWGPGWGQGWGYYATVRFIAKARNARGAAFRGKSSSLWKAKKRALRKCRHNSFVPRTCHIVRVKKVWN